MDEPAPRYQEFAQQFGDAVVGRNFEAAVSLLAPWLRDEWTSASLETAIVDYLEELDYPTEFFISWGVLNAAELRETTELERSYMTDLSPVPPEITGENFKKWMVIKFVPPESSEFDASFDFWFALVEVESDLAIGYFKIVDAD